MDDQGRPYPQCTVPAVEVAFTGSALSDGEATLFVHILYAKGKPGGLIVVHQDDLAAVAAELAPFALGSQPGGEGDPPTGARIDDTTGPAVESPTSPVLGRSDRPT
jgi:hypothetical protein